MKKQVLTVVATAMTLWATAQTTVKDTVSLGAGGANQVWYSLNNDEQAVQAKENWDLAFDTKGVNTGIRINSGAGVELWGYPKGKVSAWSTVDTTGLSTWQKRWDSDTSWNYCAMGNYANPNDPFDLDWGRYDLNTHHVLGDSIYIIKLTDGSYRKLIIESLISAKYTIKYANLDGSNEKTATVDKTGFNAAAFGYYSIVNNKTVQREPTHGDWELLFTKYTAFVPTPYPVTGVLHARGVKAVKAINIPNANAYNNYYAHTFSHEINTLGYDWKKYTGTGYDIADSTVYFLQKEDGEIWKLVFSGYGSANTSIMFSKTKLAAVTVKNKVQETIATVAVSPNPSFGNDVTVVYSFAKDEKLANISVYSLTGKLVISEKLDSSKGLHQYLIPASKLVSGTYVVVVSTADGRATQKLIVR
ncbi:MAG: T9SS type A sorting domain-containing protein [Flavipsychrobacter sp.]